MPFCEEGEYNWVVPPPGRYEVLVESAEEGEFRTGKPCVSMRFRLLSGPEKNGQFSEQMPLWKLCGFAKAVGAPRVEIDGKHGYRVETVDLLGKKFEVNTEIDEYNKEKPRCRIKPDGIKLLGEDREAIVGPQGEWPPKKTPF